ncbi:unnamed protein product [Rotaria magnacalcarata]|uniref:Uncharacterized protein n=1 Tax=Rotaria magnacalcarata TaxID=392030 RepID=A0A815ZS57_9BILA|nr:unnamed protein product [Rotaria magnacalcarata]CAF1612331.1 unnamed protein product [Rotaria magnacalcarata]CAF1938921.1 unnamed protein product [Rotaria magnacalcarata]CAF1998413.1 unnamed protein product [Rotaria magnacalcarata]CAF2150967.1 unnamed protein product [Rotaria magnacalcarata]
MHAQQQSMPYMYYTSPYSIPAYGTISSSQVVISDVNWRNSWSNIRSLVISVTLLFCSTAIIGLDIANVAIEANKQNGTSKLGSGTATVGAGIWSGSVSFMAAIFIFITIFARNKRVAATFALLAVVLTFFFTIVLIGLIGNSVQINLSETQRTNAEQVQDKLSIAILSFAVPTMIACMVFFAVYTTVLFSSCTSQSNIR